MQRGWRNTLLISSNSAIERARWFVIPAKLVTGRSSLAGLEARCVCADGCSSANMAAVAASASIPATPLSAARRVHPSSALQQLCRLVNGGTDADIGRAAAEVAVHSQIDVAVCRLLDLLEQSDRAHDLSRLAIATLRNVARDPGVADRFSLAAGQSFDGRDLAVAKARYRQRAGPQRLAIEEDGAGAALGDAATEFGTGQTEIVAQDPEHRRIGQYIDGMDLPVHLDAKLHRGFPPRSTRPRRASADRLSTLARTFAAVVVPPSQPPRQRSNQKSSRFKSATAAPALKSSGPADEIRKHALEAV